MPADKVDGGRAERDTTQRSMAHWDRDPLLVSVSMTMGWAVKGEGCESATTAGNLVVVESLQACMDEPSAGRYRQMSCTERAPHRSAEEGAKWKQRVGRWERWRLA
ncbi:hypothetical protein CDD80_2208 [Ophiocordyceps camponoti-rufipedis]|uniref:Uncharacterized protein n=1 Tax=Ophiocordyceps camponoti-rufipedis TaxID=2004952 RepID=A0A2C5XPX5_9HYPO|nr:hypothetical protein CDD80_2208 [Ophiocordyceps camponoti-rufipedis]